MFWGWERTVRQGVSGFSLDCDTQKWNYDLSVHTNSFKSKSDNSILRWDQMHFQDARRFLGLQMNGNNLLTR